MKLPLFIAFCLVFVFMSEATVSAQPKVLQVLPAACTEDAVLEKMSNDILFYVNKHRSAIGLPALQMNEAATEQAAAHSWNMANGIVSFGHDGYDERMEHIISKTGFLKATAENVASGHMTAQEVVEGWLNSPGHKRNIEGNFTKTGIGLAKASDGHIYFTQIFFRQ